LRRTVTLSARRRTPARQGALFKWDANGPPLSPNPDRPHSSPSAANPSSASPASSGAAALSMRRKWARLLVYYCTDNIAFFRGADTEFVKTLDATLQDRADITFFTGRRLFGERARARTETHLLSHGVEYSLFAQTQNPNGTVPAELEGLRQPVVGFVGAITGLDLDLIEKVARAHPNVSFVYIGTLLMDVTPLRGIDNVRFLGFRPYGVLPDYLRWFRCCIICYRRGDPFNDYRSPKKLLEYFATGHLSILGGTQ
jgi:glycosyltransferase involved in cell wall biosynthesis